MPDIVGRLRSPRLTSAPGSPAVGEMYYDTGISKLLWWSGTAWVQTGSGGAVGSTWVSVISGWPVYDVGVQQEIRAGRQLAPADFTALGLSAPIGLWNLTNLTDVSGHGYTLTNLGGVNMVGTGINGNASTAAEFYGSSSQALYIADTGASDPFRIATGSFGCWCKTAKLGQWQALIGKYGASGSYNWWLQIQPGNTINTAGSNDGTNLTWNASGLTNVCDNRWHFVVATYDGALIKVWLDGQLEILGSGTALINTATGGPLNIGGLQASASTSAINPHWGLIDEAFVTADVLTEDQIRYLYCARVSHSLGKVPTAVSLNVRRQRKGAPLSTVDFSNTPVRLYNFTAGAFTDQGSNHATLTNNGAVVCAGADGAQASAVSFAAAQYLYATDTGLPSGTSSRSYGCWIKTTALGSYGVVGWGTTGSADARIIVNTGGVLYVSSGSDGWSGPFVADGQWHFVVVVEGSSYPSGVPPDGVKRKFYLDGALVGSSQTLNSITLAGAAGFRIGSNPDGTAGFPGQVDGVFVYSGMLAGQDVAQLYAKGSVTATIGPKDPGAHIEAMNASSLYMIFDTLASQHQVSLAVGA